MWRLALLVALVCAALVAAATSVDTITASPATSLSVAWTNSQTRLASQTSQSVSVVALSEPLSNGTTHFSSTAVLPTARPNSTTSRSTQVTGGAIPQQMQASMAGLLGFCIMGLVML
ncbi:hypothetical protein JDV02_006082 [Purpureocillium takamizusanense]|uniref:Uncharacterized protein n=1 Tax=Purpureocillium takamizusanense TaxID=2060973 RepID=A0A9Q8VAZ2_9HYPO|nr:uncharacterized protein JDV02_006082 [Purpureocillium takamizusanense]UNI19940.1 hypothetical protein JDV02_006082 [Purpureocillium takamizusanense]